MDQNIDSSSSDQIQTPQYPVIHQSSREIKKSPDAIAPILSIEEPEYSLSMGYEHLNTTPKPKSDEIIKSSVKELVPIPNECEVTSEDKRDCDVLVCEDSSTFDVCDDHSDILSNSNNDDISSDEDAFEDIEYVEASLLDSELVSLEEENDVHQEDEESSASFPIFEESDNSLSLLDNSSPEFETFNDHTEETRSGKFDSVFMKDISDDSSNEPLLEEVDLFLASDNSIPPGIENFGYDSKGDIRFLKELLIDDSIPLLENESSDFDDQDDPLFPRPPSEPPDVEFCFYLEPDLISAVMNNIEELIDDECFDPGGEINVFANVEDDYYFPFIFVIRIFLPYLIYPEVSPLLLSAESEDTIFDPGIFV
nr:hypothetical protein [Tanacetum cinerariifolium]